MESDQLMVKELVILGAGGFGREASLLVEQVDDATNGAHLKLLGFIDRDESKWGQVMRGYPVLGGWDYLSRLSVEVSAICVVGDPVSKKRMLVKASECGEREYMNLLDPALVLPAFDREVSLGNGVIINRGCLFTTNIAIGNHVSINPGCGIGHDVQIGDYTTLMWRVNISGNVRIGEGCLIGSGATVLQGLTIGSGVTVGAGSVVTRDLPAGCTAVGVPARVVNETPSPRPSPARGEGN
jgi:sugar O-acyltransferase (sialic acid O-acetyltransferase NeuD family)